MPDKSNVIAFPCPVCGAGLRCPPYAAGKSSKCPACTSVVKVPGEKPASLDYATENKSTPAAAPEAQDAAKAYIQENHKTRYRALKCAGDILRCCGYLILIIAVPVLIINLIITAAASVVVVTAISMGVVGVLYIAAGEALHALRDMAINSWLTMECEIERSFRHGNRGSSK